MPLTREELDVRGCDNPNCSSLHDHTVLFFHGGCHPSAGTRVSYNKRSGNITISCIKCKDRIAEIAVAPGPQEARVIPLGYFRGH